MDLQPFLSNDDIALLKRTMLAEFGEDEQLMFIKKCQRSELDPFNGMLVPTRRQKKVFVGNAVRYIPTCAAITSIEAFIWVAERTDLYDGPEIHIAGVGLGDDGEPIWQEAWPDERGYPAIARARVHHKKHKYPEVQFANWKSYAIGADGKVSSFWDRMPQLMLCKVAHALALRRSFPNKLAGIYIREEMDNSEVSDSDHTPPPKLENAKIVIPIKSAPPLDAEEQALREEAKNLPARNEEPVEDDIPMGDQPSAEPVTEKAGTEPPMPQEPDAAWREHIIAGIKDQRFVGRRVKTLTAQELKKIEDKWLPAYEQQKDIASKEQTADAEAFRAAIASKEFEKWS